MIRGAVDYADDQHVGGWIHSDELTVRDRTVLAFVNSECVGAGKVGSFRQDLADAGIGDGYVGFSFGVTLPQGASQGEIFVKLEESDLTLLQKRSRVIDSLTAAPSNHHLVYDNQAVDWMRERGWLAQGDFDFLKMLSSTGLYDLTLRGKTGANAAQAEATRLFELYAQGPVTITERTISEGQIATMRAEILNGSSIPVVALIAKNGGVSLVEGSHLDQNFLIERQLEGAVEHKLAEDRLLFIDLRSLFTLQGDDLRLISATAP